MNENNKEKIHEVIDIIKYIIKDAIPAKSKFFALLLLNELLETKNSTFVNYFIKKILRRLYELARYKIKETDLTMWEKGASCLHQYYKLDS